MNPNLEKLYKIIEPRIDQYIFSSILSKTIAEGLERFYIHQVQDSINYAEILVSTLGNSILSNDNFVSLLIMQCASPADIEDISQDLSISIDLTEFKKRNAILKKSKTARKKSIIKHYELETAYFNEAPSAKTISAELISPFTPVPIKEKNARNLIPAEYLSLHDYQKRIKDRLIQKLIFDKPNAKMLVHMPTGSGKTKTAIEAIIDFIRVKLRAVDQGGTVVWFAHSKELCDQAYNTFKILWQFKGDFPIDVYKIFGDSDYRVVEECTSKKLSVIFIGFQKYNALLSTKDSRLRRLRYFLSNETRLAIVDEAHKSLASTYEKAIESVTQMPDCRLVGLTATPGRSNYVLGDDENLILSNFFDNEIIRITDDNSNVIEDPLHHLQERGVLAKIDTEELDFSFNFLKKGYSQQDLIKLAEKGDIKDSELDIIAVDPHRNALILEKIKNGYDLEESILVFACSKDHCIILQRLLRSYEIESEVILGSTNKQIREQAIIDFKEGTLKVIINYGVLSTGFDAPNLNTLIVARPTKSVVLYSQIVGRALRGPKNGGNERNKLITIKDNLIGFPDPEFMFSYWTDFWN